MQAFVFIALRVIGFHKFSLGYREEIRGDGLYVTALLLVGLSGLIHSIWNLFTKKSRNKVVFLWFCQWAAIFIFLPFTIKELQQFHHPIQYIGLAFLVLSVVLHGAYVVLLAKTYSIGDISQVYPIMRGTGPLLVPLVGVFLLGEHLSNVGWLGVASILLGICIIGYKRESPTLLASKTVGFAFGVGIMISGYTVVDKVVLQYIPPLTLNAATNIGNLIALSWAALASGDIRKEWMINWKTIILGGIMAPGGYILFLEALRILPVAQIAPMREIGIVFGTFLGVFLLKEPYAKKRIAASVVILSGVILLS